MKTQEELLHKELKSLRDEVKALMVDNRSLQGWRPRYEKEHAKLENLKREFVRPCSLSPPPPRSASPLLFSPVPLLFPLPRS